MPALTKVTESNLVNSVINPLKAVFNTDTAIKEFTAGYGIADIVFPYNFLTGDNLLSRNPLDNYYALLAYLSFKGLEDKTREELYVEFDYLSQTKVNSLIRLLLNYGYIAERAKNVFTRTDDDSSNPIKKIIAVEAKLSDYKNGLIQARRYKYFADECYVALSKDFSENIPINQFVESNIGLIIYDVYKGEIDKILYPQQPNNLLDFRYNSFAKELILSKLNAKVF
ncbi:hypothetical protein A2415_01600 [candidate division WWE3 bacterium RIFOXYC1_FULL_39_7]|uniref:Uncharacterized protein n=2 Tax=Katanobacteria TaxID=422282 RepID=A0A1F4X505_UNCKA|nr:MAG: hypothetical protein A2415_01600 [candidate division WWE3 bacterium RIFOXYC1_FULL_39_7]OGC76794.1 MAG: hypothetical protein A2619_00525 [candidate division WWE3 bacterium RIFOXYD1_FULL_39_9]